MQEVLGSEKYGIRHFVAYGYRIRLRPNQQSDAWPRIFDSLTRRVLSVLALFNFPVGTLIGFAILYRGRRGLRSTRGRLTKGRRASNQRNFDNYMMPTHCITSVSFLLILQANRRPPT